MGEFTAVINNVLHLIFPQSCGVCGTADTALCWACCAKIATDWQRVDQQAVYLTTPQTAGENLGQLSTFFPVYSPNRYRDVVQEITVHWKHSNLVQFERAVLQIWQQQIRQLCAPYPRATQAVSALFPLFDPAREILVVNAPSKFRRRFDDQLIAWKLALVFGEVLEIVAVEALRKKLRFPSLATLGRRYIFPTNYQVADFVARQRKTQDITAVVDLRGKQIILIDDVCTTGATLLGSARAVAAAGGKVIGGICFANAVR